MDDNPQAQDNVELDASLEGLDLRNLGSDLSTGDDAQTATSTPDEGQNQEEDNKEDAERQTATDEENADQQASGEQDTNQAGEQPNSEEARQAAQAAWHQRQRERERDRTNIERQIQSQFAPKDADQFQEEGLTAIEARLAAAEERERYSTQVAQISNLNADMYRDSTDVAAEFSVFNPNSSDYDPEFTAQVDNLYQQAAHVQVEQIGTNPDGSPKVVVTRADVGLYDFYKQMHDTFQRGAQRGVSQGQKQAAREISRSEIPGSSSTTASDPNSLEELERRIGDVRIA